MILEEQERDLRSRDEIGGAETRLEEQSRDWRSRDEIGGAGTRLEGLVVCKDKSSIVCFLLNWDLGRVMILGEQGREWRSRDVIGGA